MTLGGRRPNWGRSGQPGPREMADMIYWRALVLAGIPSLSGVAGVALSDAQPAPKKRPVASKFGAPPTLPRGDLPDEHPLVRSGRYV